MLAKVARTYFNDAVVDIQRRKALAFAIYLKNKNTTSVFKDWTIRSIARDAGIAPGTAKVRLDLLRKMHLVRIENHGGHSYLIFKKLRRQKIKNKKNDKYHTPVHLDVAISIQEDWGVRDIERYLMALDIQEHARKTEYIKRLTELGTAPKQFTKTAKHKNAKVKLERYWRKRGYDTIQPFVDHGYSYRRIQRKLHCGPQTAKNIIALGESLELFEAHRHQMVLLRYVGRNAARYELHNARYEYPNAFATSNNIFYVPVTTFSLLGDGRS